MEGYRQDKGAQGDPRWQANVQVLEQPMWLYERLLKVKMHARGATGPKAGFGRASTGAPSTGTEPAARIRLGVKLRPLSACVRRALPMYVFHRRSESTQFWENWPSVSQPPVPAQKKPPEA